MGFEGTDINEATDPVTPHLRAIDAINPMDTSFKDAIKGGVTTVMTGPGSANPMGGQFVAMKTSGICVDDMVIKEPAAIKIAFGENPKRIYKSKNKMRSEEHTSELQSRQYLVCRLLLEKKKKYDTTQYAN